jgi:hypothetical protein
MQRKRSYSEVEPKEVEFVAVETMAFHGAFRGKRDVYNCFVYSRQMYLPEYENCPVSKALFSQKFWSPLIGFLQGLFNGKKKAFSVKEVTHLGVPRYPEVRITVIVI